MSTIAEFLALNALKQNIKSGFWHDQEFANISIDSRTCEKNSLFVSLETSHAKSQDHVVEAISRGAYGVVSQHEVIVNGASFFQVRDVESAFYGLAAIWRRQFTIPIVAIAGNVGKTTTKDLLAHILMKSGLNVLKTANSQNGDQGIPATLIQLRENHEVAVVEIGIDQLGVMLKHASAVHPTAVIITSLGAEHLDKLVDTETAVQEEFNLALWAQENGRAILLNGDNHFCLSLASKYLQKENYRLYSLIGHKAGITPGVRYIGAYENTNLEIIDKESGEQFTVSSSLPGAHNASNLLGAMAMTLTLGVKPPRQLSVDASNVISGGRSELRLGPKGALFLCDFYNASPASVDAAFRTIVDVKKEKGCGQVWLCLGDMLDLGTMEEVYHRQLAEKIPNGAALLSVGPKMGWTQDELSRVKPEVRRYHFNSKTELAQVLFDLMAPMDLILIKGSRAMAMEDIWDLLVDWDVNG